MRPMRSAKPVLVGPDGTILLSGDGLRGSSLLPALKKFVLAQ